ncbi:FtsX-like permease family protein [Nonomuraea sp. NPDC059194]|uniref:ABC transporter permease n=1 Tax=Nonomuraea sp. NPDC059194 TaxID=3346764 RepID=UPI0036BB1427
MISFAISTLRHRKAGFAGAFVALLCAAALVTACGMLLETGLRGGVAPERYAGAPVIVAGDRFDRQTTRDDDGDVKTKAKPLAERRWIPASIAAELKQAPGVEKVVTEVTFPVGNALGHGWESAALTPFTLARGRAPRADDEVVVDARFAGNTLKAGGRDYRVVGVTAQALPSQDTVFFATREARRLAGRQGMVSAIGVFPSSGGSFGGQVKGALAYTGDERGAVEFLGAEKSRTMLVSLGGALGGTSLLVAVLVVVGTLALSVQQRQRELAMLRAIAATPRQIRKLLGGEALLVSAGAGVLGSGVGILLGFWLRTRFVALGAMPDNLRLVVSPFPMIAAVAATVGAAWAAALVSARRTAKIRPVEALGEAALQGAGLPRGRLVAGVLALVAGVVLTVLVSTLNTEAASSPVTMLTALVWTIAIALLGPLIAKAVTALPLRAPGASGYLSAANLRANTKRMAAVITPLSLLIAMTCTILFVQTTMGDAAREQAASGVKADHVLGAGVSAAEVRELPGVRAATEVLRTSVRIDLARYGAQAVTTEGLDQTMDLGVVAGSLQKLDERSVAVSTTAADRLGVAVGSTLALTLGDGTPAKLTVAAVYGRGLGFGDLTLSHALVAGHVDNPHGSVLVAGGDRAVLERYGAQLPTEVSVSNPAVTYVAMGLIVAFCAIAVVNTLAMSTAARTRELALLRLAGTTRRQVLRMLRMESLAAVLVSTVLGSAVALVTLMAFSTGMTGSATPSVPPLTYLAVVAGAAALALAATAIPGRFALSTPPAEAIGARE